MASGSVFLLGGTGVDDGGKVGGATRGKDLELELENVTERNLPPLQDKSLSGKIFTALKKLRTFYELNSIVYAAVFLEGETNTFVLIISRAHFTCNAHCTCGIPGMLP